MDRPTRVLLDTNIALDLLLAREPFAADALHIFALGEAGRLELLLSADAVSTIFYVVRKNKDSAVAREAMAKLLDLVRLADLNERSELRAMALDFADFEDALVAAVAERENAEVIVTRNVKDFQSSPVPTLAPDVFLAAWRARDAASS